MSTFLTILLIASMIATVAVLVRGLIVFLLASSAHAREGTTPDGLNAAAVKSNKMMQYRIMFQAIAIFLVVLILWLGGHS